jgi:hypothetical protein
MCLKPTGEHGVKKLVIGCGLALVLVGVLGAVGAYVFVYRPAKALISSGSELMASVNRLNELDARVANVASFTAPADGALTEAQVTRYVAVMDGLHTKMGARATELEAKYKALKEREGEAASIATVLGAYRDVFQLVLDAKEAQVAGLNAQNFSMDEYQWVRTRVYEAAGVQVTGIDLRELAESAKNGNFDALSQMAQNATGTSEGGTPSMPPGDTPGVGIPDVNKTLVAPHKERLETWFAYAMFGL